MFHIDAIMTDGGRRYEVATTDRVYNQGEAAQWLGAFVIENPITSINPIPICAIVAKDEKNGDLTRSDCIGYISPSRVESFLLFDDGVPDPNGESQEELPVEPVKHYKQMTKAEMAKWLATVQKRRTAIDAIRQADQDMKQKRLDEERQAAVARAIETPKTYGDNNNNPDAQVALELCSITILDEVPFGLMMPILNNYGIKVTGEITASAAAVLSRLKESCSNLDMTILGSARDISKFVSDLKGMCINKISTKKLGDIIANQSLFSNPDEIYIDPNDERLTLVSETQQPEPDLPDPAGRTPRSPGLDGEE